MLEGGSGKKKGRPKNVVTDLKRVGKYDWRSRARDRNKWRVGNDVSENKIEN